METCRAITAGLQDMHGAEVLGDPKAMVVAFKCTSAACPRLCPRPRPRPPPPPPSGLTPCNQRIPFPPAVSTYAVSDRMAKRGWSLNALQMPASIHICCTLCVAAAAVPAADPRLMHRLCPRVAGATSAARRSFFATSAR